MKTEEINKMFNWPDDDEKFIKYKEYLLKNKIALSKEQLNFVENAESFSSRLNDIYQGVYIIHDSNKNVTM